MTAPKESKEVLSRCSGRIIALSLVYLPDDSERGRCLGLKMNRRQQSQQRKKIPSVFSVFFCSELLPSRHYSISAGYPSRLQEQKKLSPI
jgi:hypothetical protein